MTFFILLLLSIIAGGLRFCFEKTPPSLFGTYEALAHVLVGALIMAAIQFGRPVRRNPFFLLLLSITLIELDCFILG